MKTGSSILKQLEKEGWEFDGDLIERLDMESDFLQDALLDRNYEYLSVSIAMKRSVSTLNQQGEGQA